MVTKLVVYLKALIAMLWALLNAIVRALTALLAMLARGKLSVSEDSPDCCLRPPEGMRPRPDPSIYSQEWLHLRGIGFTWDNPDFTLYDSFDNVADRMALKPGEVYRVVVRTHNGSLLAAIGTTVALEVLEFGIGGIVIEKLGSVTVDIPTLGAAPAEFKWMTPATGGHNCLRARLHHPDDGNPLNNVGQHNTEVAKPASPTRAAHLVLRNSAPGDRTLRLELDGYRLPAEPMRPSSERRGLTRNSSEYLLALQERNRRSRFPVAEALQARLAIGAAAAVDVAKQEHGFTVDVAAGASVPLTLITEPAPAGGERQVVNLHAFDGAALVGGVTIHIDPLEI